MIDVLLAGRRHGYSWRGGVASAVDARVEHFRRIAARIGGIAHPVGREFLLKADVAYHDIGVVAVRSIDDAVPPELLVGIAELVLVVAQAYDQRSGLQELPCRAAVDIVGFGVRIDIVVGFSRRECAPRAHADRLVRIEQAGDETDRLIERGQTLKSLVGLMAEYAGDC